MGGVGEVFKKKEKGEKKEREGIRGEQGSLRVEKGKMEQGGGSTSNTVDGEKF